MKTFEFEGTFKKGSKNNHPFRKKVEAESKSKAIEKLYSLIGAAHKCPRRFIKIKNG